jgi:uncharacterized protein (DUF1499 family)
VTTFTVNLKGIMDKSSILGICFIALAFAACSAGKPAGLGLKQGRLAPCPKTPNCVATQDADEQHGIEPIPYTTSQEQALETMRGIILSMPRAKIVSSSEDYIHAEFRSKLFRFVDDVEFYFDAPRKLIDFRSASRVGHSDLGVNRKRMEEIREKFIASGK